MTSPELRAAAARRIGCAIAMVALLAGCDVGQPGTFTARTEKTCAEITRVLAADNPVTHPVAYTMDRFTELDRLLAQVSTDDGFPGGTTGRDLRVGWLDPARSSLRVGRGALEHLREIVRSAGPGLAPAFDAAARAGSTGVDLATLRRDGLTRCAEVFAAAAPVPPG